MDNSLKSEFKTESDFQDFQDSKIIIESSDENISILDDKGKIDCEKLIQLLFKR